MLDLKSDRIDYGEQLHPPEGYELDKAIAATYSLDLATLMTIPVALFHSRYLDETSSETRMDVLDAIQKASKKIRVFCHKGNIKVPSTYHEIYTFLESVVNEVLPENDKSSFHPKFWIIRYINDQGSSVFRLIVLSRNLTFDRSWDVAFSTEGIPGSTSQNNNESLVGYLSDLVSDTDFDGTEEFLSELRKVDFKIPDDFDGQDIFPISSNESSNYRNPLDSLLESEEEIDNVLIISPFVDETTLRDFKEKTRGDFYLFSRKHELDNITPTLFEDIEPYIVSNIVLDIEQSEQIQDSFEVSDTQSDDQEDGYNQDIHAKVFVIEQDGAVYWFLGSSNATSAALHRNDEMLVRLVTRDESYGVHEVFETLNKSDEDTLVFEYYEPENKEKAADQDSAMRSYIYQFIEHFDNSAAIGVECKESEEDSTYSITVQIQPWETLKNSQFDVKFKPYGYNGKMRPIKSQGNEFHKIAKARLSQFIQWQVTNNKSGDQKTFLLKFNIKNLPSDREKHIITKLLSDPDRFFSYISFLLGDENPTQGIINRSKSPGNKKSGRFPWLKDSPILEKLLVSASRDENKLSEIDRILQQIDPDEEDEAIKEFKKFWQPFKNMYSDG